MAGGVVTTNSLVLGFGITSVVLLAVLIVVVSVGLVNAQQWFLVSSGSDPDGTTPDPNATNSHQSHGQACPLDTS